MRHLEQRVSKAINRKKNYNTNKQRVTHLPRQRYTFRNKYVPYNIYVYRLYIIYITYICIYNFATILYVPRQSQITATAATARLNVAVV